MKKCWYYANGGRSIEEVSEEADIGEGNVRSTFSDLHKEKLVVKERRGGQTYYNKHDMTKNIGIDAIFREEIDDL